jgi:hypothetical protein
MQFASQTCASSCLYSYFSLLVILNIFNPVTLISHQVIQGPDNYIHPHKFRCHFQIFNIKNQSASNIIIYKNETQIKLQFKT